MRARVLSSRSGRAVAVLTAATMVAAGLVLAGGGSSRQADAAVSPGTTQLVSVGRHSPFKDSGQAAISGDGRYVAFTTLKSFDPIDIGREDDSDLDVYVRDLKEQKTILLSHGILLPLDQVIGTEGLPDVLTAPASGHSGNPSISADGRYVAFQTTANNLGPQDHDVKSDVVVVDRDPDGDGVFDEKICPLLRLYCHEFTRVSPNRVDDQGRPIAGAGTPSLSAAGDAVAWVGVSLPAEVTPRAAQSRSRGVPVVYLSALAKGPTGALTATPSQQVNARTDGLLVRGETAPALSADGRRLALVAHTQSIDGTAGTAILGVDFAAGPLPETGGEGFAAARLDVDENGRPLSLPSRFDAAPTLSGHGRLVAFTAPGAGSQVVRTVRWEGEQRSAVVSVDTSGQPVHGTHPALSASGRYLAFTTAARNTHNGVDGPETTCDPGASPPGVLGLGLGLRIDVDLEIDIDPLIYLAVGAEIDIGLGRDAIDPPPAQPPASAGVSHCDVVVRDLVLDRARAAAELPRLPAELASPSLARTCVEGLAADDTCEGDEASGYPALSADGGVVAYESQATTLVQDDPNGDDPNGGVQDVFARTFAPRLAADPLNFFTIEPGSSTLGSAPLRHVGFGPLLVESMTISGLNTADFTLTAETCLGRTLQAGESCLASVRFTPSEVGPREAVLEVRHRGTGSPLLVPLLGVGDTQPPRAVTVIPEPLPFGENLPLSTNPPGDVTVRNTGAAPLTINAVGIPADAGPQQHPEDYAITTDGCTGRTLQPGATCTVTVRHSPQGVGERRAVLRFDDNAPNSPHLVALEGSGTQPRLQFNPAVVQEGRVTTAFGSGFAPQRTVTLRLPGIPGPIILTTDPGGNFTTPVVIFPNAVPGARTTEATLDGHQPPITATTSLLIVPGTVSPPNFAERD